jgi:hypothetical protein
MSASGQYINIVGGAPAALYSSSDYGETFTYQFDTTGSQIEMNATGQYQIATLRTYGSYTISTNFGATWVDVGGNVQGFPGKYFMDSSGQNIIYTGGVDGLLYQSFSQLAPNAQTHGDYLYWNSFTNAWDIDGQTISLGSFAGQTGQGLYGIALGASAGNYGQSGFAIAIGYYAGATGQKQYSIAIGANAGQTGLTAYSIAVGAFAGASGQNSISVGPYAGQNLQGAAAIALGWNAGQNTQGPAAVAVGSYAGQNSQDDNAIAVGYYAGYSNQSIDAIAVGSSAGSLDQGKLAVAVGANAGNSYQAARAIAIGNFAGNYGQQNDAIAIGPFSGQISQSYNSLAIGMSAGQNGQGNNSVAIGTFAGSYQQGPYSVALGYAAGQTSQDYGAVAVGSIAGCDNQGYNTVAIGYFAGSRNQGNNAVAIGYQAGQTSQGANAIAIGSGAAPDNQAAGSIVIYAGATSLSNTTTAGFFVKPVRNVTTYSGLGSTGLMVYNSTTNEISYNTAKSFVIDHPTNKNKYLVHTCLEGPEAGVYYRGKGEVDENNSEIIELPDYVSRIATNFTVHVAPIFDKLNSGARVYQVSEVKDGRFTVYGPTGGFSWIVHGERESVIVEPLKSSVEVKGMGPYKWI